MTTVTIQVVETVGWWRWRRERVIEEVLARGEGTIWYDVVRAERLDTAFEAKLAALEELGRLQDGAIVRVRAD
jgi:hypothetical protein